MTWVSRRLRVVRTPRERERLIQRASNPASRMNSEPVMARAFAEARNTTASATSWGSIQGMSRRLPAEALGNLLRRFSFEHRQAVVHRRVDSGRAKRDDTNVVRGQFDGPRARQPDEPPLRCRVMRKAPHAAEAGHRRVIDDHTPALFDHVGYDAARHNPGPFQVDVEHRVPRVFRQLVRQSIAADSCVVEQDINCSKTLGGCSHRGAHGNVVTNIGGKRQTLDAQSLALRRQAPQIVD